MTRRWQNDPAFEKQVHQFYEAVAIPDRASRDAEIRRVLAPLAALASRRRVAVVGVMHLKKSDTSALLRFCGSIGFFSAARVVWGFGSHPAPPEPPSLAPLKHTLAPPPNAPEPA